MTCEWYILAATFNRCDLKDMLLTLDVGNSHIHAGLFDEDELVLQFRYTTASCAW